MKRLLVVALVCALAALCLCCNTWPLKSDQKAKDSVLALKKLEARLEIGLSNSDYSTALGEANFAVTQFLESDRADSAPEFSNSLRDAMKWYKAAAQLWSRQLKEASHTGFCDAKDNPWHHVEDLCDAYPELVARVLCPRWDTCGRPGLIFELAEQESWKRAAFELRNADRALNGQKIEKMDGKLFKTDEGTEQKYLLRDAREALGLAP